MKSLLAVIGVFSLIAVYRAIHFAITGFFVPDEYGYIYFHLGDLSYQGRDFFDLVNLLFFKATRMTSVDSIILLMPIYLIAWFSVGIIAAWKTIELLGFSRQVRASTIVVSAFVPVFFLFSAALITESVAFAMVMLGVYFTARFKVKGEYWAPPLVGLCFVAAAYTRLDFTALQLLGWLPLAIAEGEKPLPSRVLRVAMVISLFAIPAAFFMVWPNDIPAAIPGTVSSIGTVGSSTSNPPPFIEGIYNASPFVRILYNTSFLFSSGFAGGFGPIPAFLIIAGFFVLLYRLLKRHDSSFIFSLACILLSPFVGIALVYSPAALGLFLGTVVRYAYDAMPAFFILAPVILAKFGGKKFRLVIATGLILFLISIGLFSQPVLQSSLSSSYPFLSGNQPFLTLDYRTPYAAMRDFFLSQPPQTLNYTGPEGYYVLAEDPGSLDSNVSNMWRFTPGVSRIHVIFEPYSWGCVHPGTYYVYIPPDINKTTLCFDYRTIPPLISGNFIFGTIRT